MIGAEATPSAEIGAGEVVCVVGMHRSGTSVITRVLNILGVSLGPDDQLMEANERDNPTGYWENAPIVEFNDDLLSALGGTWDAPPPLSDGWEHGDAVHAFVPRARELAEAVVTGSAIAGWKDPRMSLLLPFWKTILPITFTVLAVRHPFQVAGSLADRDGMDSETAAALWTRYTVAAWRSHEQRIVVGYDALLSDPMLGASHLAAFLGLTDVPIARLQEVASFVDRRLDHHAADDYDVGPQMALALSLYTMIGSQPFELLDGVIEAVAIRWSPPQA